MTQELREDIQRRVLAVQRRYHDGGRVLRAVWLVAAVIVVAVGLAMTLLPGPATIVIPVGLAMLAVRFAWAQSALHAMIDRGVRARRRVAKASPVARTTGIALGIAIVALAAVLLLR